MGKVTLREVIPVHGPSEKDTETLKKEESWDWLSKGNLKSGTEFIDRRSGPSLKQELCPKEHLSSSRVGQVWIMWRDSSECNPHREWLQDASRKRLQVALQ